MAIEPDMKDEIRRIDASEAEMARYRHGLAARLDQRAARRRFAPWPWLMAAAAAVLIFALLPAEESPFAAPRELAELEALVQQSGDAEALRRQATRQANAGKGWTRWNAMMTLCLLQPDGDAIQTAADAVLEEPRPEFRAYYLEYLLDFVDERPLNAALIEDVMARETDPLCFDLFEALLRLAV